MGLVQSHSGLLLPEGALEAAVTRALKQHDPELRLVPQESERHGTHVYKVYRSNGPDRDASFVCGWWDDQLNPLPLSMAIVDMVQLHDRNTVGRAPDEDELERQYRAEKRKDYLRDAEAIVKEFGPKVDGKSSTPQPRSRQLYLARQRERQRRERWPKDMRP